MNNTPECISCEICADLIPLVRDGIASNSSCLAVEEHIKTCPNCQNLLNTSVPPESNPAKVFRQINRRLQLFSALVMMFGIFFGLGLTASDDLFYNSLIMPVIGILGYLIYRWRALYQIPLILLLTHSIIELFQLIRGLEHLDMYSLLMWTIIYSFFTAVGTVIAGLFHFAFCKEDV